MLCSLISPCCYSCWCQSKTHQFTSIKIEDNNLSCFSLVLLLVNINSCFWSPINKTLKEKSDTRVIHRTNKLKTKKKKTKILKNAYTRRRDAFKQKNQNLRKYTSYWIHILSTLFILLCQAEYILISHKQEG